MSDPIAMSTAFDKVPDQRSQLAMLNLFAQQALFRVGRRHRVEVALTADQKTTAAAPIGNQAGAVGRFGAHRLQLLQGQAGEGHFSCGAMKAHVGYAV